MYFAIREKKDLKKIRGIMEIFGKKNFIMLLHADWCGHCQVFMKTWNSFVKKSFKTYEIIDIEHSMFSQIQSAALTPATKTFVSLIQNLAQGFPTIVKVSKANKSTQGESSTKSSVPTLKVDIFNGNRNLRELEEFAVTKS